MNTHSQQKKSVEKTVGVGKFQFPLLYLSDKDHTAFICLNKIVV
jgi:hypothetical protein